MRFPDFMIIGAMKAGTSTLHWLLAEHPQVFIPTEEVFLFDIDDVEQHPDFFACVNGRWARHAFSAHREDGFRWYQQLYSDAVEGQLRGEHSTTYLASLRAPARIAREAPGTKIIASLRDPTDRAYAQYWHEVQAGLATRTFEDALQHAPGTLIQRSLYGRQVRAYFDHFPREQLHFIGFEDLIADVPAALLRIYRLLGIDERADLSGETHHNATLLPRSPALRRARNRLFKKWEFVRYASRLGLPGYPDTSDLRPGSVLRAVDRLLSGVNPMSRRPVPPMRPDTRRFLNDLFRRENEGLDELLGSEFESKWYRE